MNNSYVTQYELGKRHGLDMAIQGKRPPEPPEETTKFTSAQQAYDLGVWDGWSYPILDDIADAR